MNKPETTALHISFKVYGRPDWFWLNCFTLSNTCFSWNLLWAFHPQKTSIILSFHPDLELKQTSACQNSFKMEMLRKVARLFLSAIPKDKWLSAQKRARASLVRKKHRPNDGCPGWDQLGGCCKPCVGCWTAPAGEENWEGDGSWTLTTYPRAAFFPIQPGLLVLTMATLEKFLCFH